MQIDHLSVIRRITQMGNIWVTRWVTDHIWVTDKLHPPSPKNVAAHLRKNVLAVFLKKYWFFFSKSNLTKKLFCTKIAIKTIKYFLQQAPKFWKNWSLFSSICRQIWIILQIRHLRHFRDPFGTRTDPSVRDPDIFPNWRRCRKISESFYIFSDRWARFYREFAVVSYLASVKRGNSKY